MTSFSFVLANIVLLLKSIIFCQPFTQKILQGQLFHQFLCSRFYQKDEKCKTVHCNLQIFVFRAHPIKIVNAKKLLQVFAIFLNAFSILIGSGFPPFRCRSSLLTSLRWPLCVAPIPCAFSTTHEMPSVTNLN